VSDVTAKDHIVLLGSHAPLCERVKRAGLGLVVVDTADSMDPDALGLADHVVITDYAESARTAAVLAALVPGADVVGVLSLTERGQLPSAEINALLGIDDNPVAVVRRVVDKAHMRRWLAGDDRFAVASAVVQDPEELRRFADRSGFPLIVKPPNGVGSIGVRRLGDAGEIVADLFGDKLPLLAEAYLEGREYSVEAVSHEGRHAIVGITEKLVIGEGPNGFVEVGHRFPAVLDEDEEQALRTFVAGFLDRLGLRRGLSHTELIVAAGGPAVIETHSRNGGDHIADLVRLATGFDMLDFAVHARAGLIGEIPAVPAPARAAAIRYFTPEPGVVCDVFGVGPARYLPGVVDIELDLRRGVTVPAITCSSDRVGYVIAVGADVGGVARTCSEAMGMVKITTEAP
jgi:biotin carboxylase